MKMETEITVKVVANYETLHEELIKKGFSIKEEYVVNDDYLVPNNVDLYKEEKLNILKKCILIRDVVGIEKCLLHKYKEYDKNGDIIKQGKLKCPIDDIDKALKFMESIKYHKLFSIYDKCIVYANDKTELIVQLVNDKYIFIEVEDKGEYIKRKYNGVEELKEDLLSYNLPIDTSNFFVKKALILLEETLNGK